MDGAVEDVTPGSGRVGGVTTGGEASDGGVTAVGLQVGLVVGCGDVGSTLGGRAEVGSFGGEKGSDEFGSVSVGTAVDDPVEVDVGAGGGVDVGAAGIVNAGTSGVAVVRVTVGALVGAAVGVAAGSVVGTAVGVVGCSIGTAGTVQMDVVLDSVVLDSVALAVGRQSEEAGFVPASSGTPPVLIGHVVEDCVGAGWLSLGSALLAEACSRREGETSAGEESVGEASAGGLRLASRRSGGELVGEVPAVRSLLPSDADGLCDLGGGDEPGASDDSTWTLQAEPADACCNSCCW